MIEFSKASQGVVHGQPVDFGTMKEGLWKGKTGVCYADAKRGQEQFGGGRMQT